MANIADIIEGGLYVDKDGTKITRVFIITDVVAGADYDVPSAALSASGLTYGQSHPSLSSLIITNITCEPIPDSPSKWKIVANYELPSLDTQEPDETGDVILQVGATLTAAKTNKDKDGNQLVVDITTAGGEDLEQTGEVDIQVPQIVIQIERKEESSPITKAANYVGRVNDAIWNGWPARSVLITAIEGVTEDGGETYSVTYKLQVNQNTWDVDLVFIDEATDKPHVDIDIGSGNGVVTETVYPEANFVPLSIAY